VLGVHDGLPGDEPAVVELISLDLPEQTVSAD